MYTCKHFAIEELVSPEWYQYARKKGTVSLLWRAFDESLLKALDGLREMYGPLIVNDWKSGGSRTYSGLRPLECIGAVCSQHKFGRAIDFISKTVTPRQIYEDLVSAGGLKAGFRQTHPDSPWALVQRLEYYPGITWTHIDCLPQSSNGSIKVFSS